MDALWIALALILLPVAIIAGNFLGVVLGGTLLDWHEGLGRFDKTTAGKSDYVNVDTLLKQLYDEP